jgi:hypothetical protein
MVQERRAYQKCGRFLLEFNETQPHMYCIVLEIDNVEPLDAGSYVCIAKNPKGEAERILILRPEDIAEPQSKASNETAPTFKDKPRDQVGIDGDRIIVSCKVTGNPKPEVTWYKNKQPLQKSKDFSMDFNGETAKLTINDAYVEDTGDYSCQIWNEVGQQESSFKILIKEKKGKPKRTRAAAPKAPVPNIMVSEDEPPKVVVNAPEGIKKKKI